MKTIELKDFIPFPGNYFSYVFRDQFDLENSTSILLSNPLDKNLFIEGTVIQSVKVGNSLKVQFHARKVIFTHAEENLSFSGQEGGHRIVTAQEKQIFKDLLEKWDSAEFGAVPNYYFEQIDKANESRQLLNLVGGSICRPNKYPFDSEGLEKALDSRIRILRIATVDNQLLELRKVIQLESIRGR